MKRIVVISDTHWGNIGMLPAALERGLSGADLILHAGDITSDNVLDLLEMVAPVRAVRGNCDEYIDDSRAPVRRIVKAGGCRIGMMHSLGVDPSQYGAAAEEEFGGEADCVVFGHSHKPYENEYNGIILFNPGSAGQRRTQRFYSYGIMTVDSGKIISREIVYF